jgi:3-deoxy-D-manno-octulosonic-acid transferase
LFSDDCFGLTMQFAYSLLWYALLPFLFLRLWWRGRLAPAYRQRWNERLAIGYAKPPLHGCVWLHAVSVGEFLAAAPLVEALLVQHPHTPLLITTTTPTGSERVRAHFGDRVQHVYCPWELPDALTRFMRHFRPRLGIIMETELWPNLTRAAEQNGCQLLLANGRLSAKSSAGYARLPSLTRPLLKRFARLSVQTDIERQRFIALGAAPDCVVVGGSIKFDIRLPDDLRQKAAAERQHLGERPVWIAASTHLPEETSVIAAHQQLLRTQPDALLIWVPRHPERFDAVAMQLQNAGLPLARRSQHQQPSAGTAVWLIDTMGELLLFYGVADMAFVGGSLDASLGGHNLLEPAAWGKPVLSGPFLTNFRAIADILKAENALTCVTSARALAENVQALFANDALRQERGNAASRVVAANRGALQKLVTLVESFWPDTH